MALNPALLAAIKGAKAKHAGPKGKIVGLKEGKNRVRILPNPDPELPFWHDLGVHWIKPEKNAKPMAVVGCHDHTYDKPCPICVAIDKAAKLTTDDDELEVIKEMTARKQVLVNALMRNGENPNDPVVLGLTSTTFSNLCSIIEEYAEEFGDVLDLKNGLDFVIERTGKGLDTKYSIMPAPKSEAVGKDVMSRIVDLKEFVSQEYFRNDTKALNAIAEITGVAPVVSHATKAMLTGPKAKIVEADAEELPAPTPRKKPAPAPEPEADVDEIVEEGMETKPAPKKATVASTDSDDLPEDIEDILKDLDSL